MIVVVESHQEVTRAFSRAESIDAPGRFEPLVYTSYTSSTMSRRRTFRRSMTALFAVFSLLFAQLVMANYACPAEADGSSMAEQAAAGTSCDEMDTAQPALCHRHAADTAQSFEVLKVPTPSLPAVIQVLVLPVVPEATGAELIVRLASAEAQPPPDPLFLSTRRLRV